jgi:hypothetical protein
MFVAGGANGFSRSSDGVTWTAVTLTGYTLDAICWSSERGLFVAACSTGVAGKVLTSPDGITWTPGTTFVGDDSSWRGICWSPEVGLFVAVALSGTNKIMTSPDGINWTVRSFAENVQSFFSVCWSSQKNLFIAVSVDGSNQVVTSSDGINWSGRSPSEASGWYSIAWSPELGRFACVAATGTVGCMTLDLPQLNTTPIQNGQREGQKATLVGVDGYNSPELKTAGAINSNKDDNDKVLAIRTQKAYELEWDSVNLKWVNRGIG